MGSDRKKRRKSYKEDNNEINELEYLEIHKKIDSIDDLIELGNMYYKNKRKRCNIDLWRLKNLISPLTELKNIIGMDTVKQDIVNQIIYYLQDLEDNKDNMMHTVIQGPPGVGKSLLGKIIGEIYYNMGIIKSSNRHHRFNDYRKRFPFKVARRSDLIGRYLGETAIKTQKVIDSCYGGVLFIDEAYSLGNEEGRDSFSKECLDTLNQNLTENKGNFLCIIAGYKDSLEKCFFSYNDGLKRRFPFVYSIEKYTPIELYEIFNKMVIQINWKLDNIDKNFFIDNYEYFPNFGGDIETFLFKCKIEHSKRVFCLGTEEKKKITNEDVNNGLNQYKKHKKINKEKKINTCMYL